MFVQPYLWFDGRCEEAIEFYKKAVGAEVQMMMRMKDSPDPHPPGMVPPGGDNKVMHCAFKVGDTVVLASDGEMKGRPEFRGFSLSVTAKDVPEAERMFSALAAGGQVQMPLTATFFAHAFGMLADRFGVNWMMMVPKPM